MAEKALPDLETVVQQVLEKRLRELDFPVRLSTETVRRFHEDAHIQYYRPGRKESLPKGALKRTMRAYLERQYRYIEEGEENPLKPGKNIITKAYYLRPTKI